MTIDERDLGRLARDLPVSSTEPARRAALREAVLRAVDRAPVRTAGRSRATVVGITIALAAAAAGIVFVLAHHAAAPKVASHRATVQSTAAADLQHTTHVARGIHDEVVRLRGGRVSISVERLARNERFRVIAGDGEVEVRGTAFDVLVVDDRLTEVTVHHGLVDVRVADEAGVAVAGGQQWSRTAGVRMLATAPRSPAPTGDAQAEQRATTVSPNSTSSAAQPQSPIAEASTSLPRPPSSTTATPTPSRAMASSSTSTPSRRSTTASPSSVDDPSLPGPTEPVAARGPSSPDAAASPSDTAAVEAPPRPTPRSPTERAFDAGRAALRGGDFGTAAERFREAVVADPDASLAEDARYWRGIALARAGRDADARVALAEFLAHHPRSLRVGRASIVVGNLLVRAGELAAARARFEAALVDSDPDVRSAARAALAALPPPRP